ncbi:hypothetical protein ACLEX5_04250 [Enterobacter ludwigii]|uniref:hypothetical protein n=1 Tax=Enterobacter ludwigii TaxID=299767 RepID=UPI003976F6EA
MKAKIAIWLIGFVLGVPVTIAGVEWAMFKYNKQLVNCGTDAVHASMSVMDLEKYSNSTEELNLIAENLDKCKNEASPLKSNLDFMRDEMGWRNY